jgi:hypothetical protein
MPIVQQRITTIAATAAIVVGHATGKPSVKAEQDHLAQYLLLLWLETNRSEDRFNT